MIKQFQDFYKWIFNRVDYKRFCNVLQIKDDAYSLEKFGLMKSDFGGFLCNCEDFAVKLYAEYCNERINN